MPHHSTSLNLARRRLVQGAAQSLILTTAPLAWATSAKGPQEGTDYRLVKPSQPTQTGNKIEIVEFFWYGCPHCFQFEPLLEEWVKRLPTDVAFRRTHAAFFNEWVPHQKLYYSLDSIGKANDLHKKAFNAIHVEKRPMNNGEQIADWAAQQGLDRKTFLDTFNSFSVATRCNRATQETNAWAIKGVPALGLQGKYLTSASLTGNHEKTLAVASELIEQIRQGKK